MVRGCRSIEVTDEQGVISPYLPWDFTILPSGKSLFPRGDFILWTLTGQRDKCEGENGESSWITTLRSQKLTRLFKTKLRASGAGTAVTWAVPGASEGRAVL